MSVELADDEELSIVVFEFAVLGTVDVSPGTRSLEAKVAIVVDEIEDKVADVEDVVRSDSMPELLKALALTSLLVIVVEIMSLELVEEAVIESL